MKSAVQEVARVRAGQELDAVRCCTFAYQPRQEEPVRCSAGLQVYRLGRKGVRHMLDTSKFDKQKNFDEMMHLVRNAPSAGVYEDASVESETVVDVAVLPFGPEEETPLAWITTSFYGGLAILMTEERHRGRGLAKLVTQVAARMLVAQGYVPHAHAEAKNVPSVKMFKTLPGWQEIHMVSGPNHTSMWQGYSTGGLRSEYGPSERCSWTPASRRRNMLLNSLKVFH
ncbi:uncharacterized protein LOC122262233 [Penaeus japonicus]|uniref:uncharacterized protein LOC122262233 n=1 Tax=Penaeus japonicus TaxID=27405 RepID=UPI001C712167|nr:uncharacterized protein LOC122262233 [Penaeus japonicus]